MGPKTLVLTQKVQDLAPFQSGPEREEGGSRGPTDSGLDLLSPSYPVPPGPSPSRSGLQWSRSSREGRHPKTRFGAGRPGVKGAGPARATVASRGQDEAGPPKVTPKTPAGAGGCGRRVTPGPTPGPRLLRAPLGLLQSSGSPRGPTPLRLEPGNDGRGRSFPSGRGYGRAGVVLVIGAAGRHTEGPQGPGETRLDISPSARRRVSPADPG